MSDDVTPIERAGLVADLLRSGESLSTADVVQLTGCHVRTAQRTMSRLSRVIPIIREGERWVHLQQIPQENDT